MSNMSYCRFQNTSNDLADCQNAIAELIDNDHGKLSREELDSAKHLVQGCLEIIRSLADAHNIDIDADGGMDILNNTFEGILDDLNSQAPD